MDKVLITNLTLEAPTYIAAVNMFLGKSSGNNTLKERELYNIRLWEESWECGIPEAELTKKLRVSGVRMMESGIVELREVICDMLGDYPKYIELGFIRQLDDDTVLFSVMDFLPGPDDKKHQ